MGRAALALVLLALGAVGCLGGSGPSASSEDIVHAARKTVRAGSLEADFTITGAGLSGQGNGVFNTGPAASGQLRMNVLTGGGQVPVDTIVAGEVLYLRSPVFARSGVVSGDKQWVKLDLAELEQRRVDITPVLAASPTPANALAFLAGSIGEVKKIGAQKLHGVDTTHYHVTTDLERAAKQARGSERRSLQRLVRQSGVRKVPLDVWIDANGYIRRVRYEEHTGRAPAARVAMDLHDFGAPISIKPPPRTAVVDLLQLRGQGR